jgi:inorganic pyrophosphatase
MATAPSPDAMSHNSSEYSVRRSGRPFTKEYRVYFERAKDKVPVSPFHDIPLYHDKEKGILNMVVEIPRWSNAKFEVSSNYYSYIQSMYHD